MLNIILSLIFSFLLTASATIHEFHEFHTSLAQVHYNKTSQSFEITLRVFTDDLEAALTLMNKSKKVVIDNAQADKLIEQYLVKNLVLFDKQNQNKSLSFIGKEVEVDVTWIYAEVPVTEALTGLRLQNSVLTELYSDQVNIVNFKYLTTIRTFIFKPSETVQSLGI
jgi:hypothetical protein